MQGLIAQYFFFSSRRRHTRLVSDWSSDVCSSDLDGVWIALLTTLSSPLIILAKKIQTPSLARSKRDFVRITKIGRASCRERVESTGAAVAVKKKNSGEGKGKGHKQKRETDRTAP